MKLNVFLSREGTPRAWFVVNEVCVGICNTRPPIRGVHVYTQTLFSFHAREARGVLHRTTRTLEEIFQGTFYG